MMSDVCCCVSLSKWKIHTNDQHDKLWQALETFKETECPNRLNIQQTYVTALIDLESEVIKNMNVLKELNCSPLKIASMQDSPPDDRTFVIYWNDIKNITSNKHQVCGEDVEFQGGRKVQLHPVPAREEVIEYQCSTPKKGGAPWSRSIVKLRGSQLWVVNYRPRRMRTSENNSPRPKRGLSNSGGTKQYPKRSKLRDSLKGIVKRPRESEPPISTLDHSQFAVLRASRSCSDNSLQFRSVNSVFPSGRWTAGPKMQCMSPTTEPTNFNPGFLSMDTDFIPYSPQPTPPVMHRVVERTVSDPHKHAQLNWRPANENQFSFAYQPLNSLVEERERFMMYLIDKAVTGENSLRAVAIEASKLLNHRDLQLFNSVMRLVIATPLHQKCTLLSKQSRLLLYTVGCMNTMGSIDECIVSFTNLFVAVFNNADPHPEPMGDGMWQRIVAFVKSHQYIHGQRRTRYMYLTPGWRPLFSSLLKLKPEDDIVGKIDFALFDEPIALQFMEEDFRAMDTSPMGILADNPLPLPCNHCNRCELITSKLHISLREGSFIFGCAAAVQCVASNSNF